MSFVDSYHKYLAIVGSYASIIALGIAVYFLPGSFFSEIFGHPALFYIAFGVVQIAIILVYRRANLKYVGSETIGLLDLFPTYAVLGRTIALLGILFTSILVDDLKKLLVIYDVYFLFLLVWARFDNYHTGTSKLSRAIFDFAIAWVAVFWFGGIFTPLVLLFLIPLCTLSRKFSPPQAGLCLFSIIVVCFMDVILFHPYLAGITKQSWIHLFVHAGEPTEIVNIASLSLSICILLAGLFIFSFFVLYVERRMTFLPLLAQSINFAKIAARTTIEDCLKRLIKDVCCEAVVFVCGPCVHLVWHHREFGSTGKLVNDDYIYKEYEIENTNRIIKMIENDEDDAADWASFYVRYTRIMYMIIKESHALKISDHFQDFSPISAAFASAGTGGCLIAFNNMSHLSIARKRFSRELWFQIRLAASIMKPLCNKEGGKCAVPTIIK